ncbi:MAG: Gx transporter family protein [Oscillospiraceae bacterium]|jgi:heptaprenyl diphosphate synthase|nr:Gx transporter family protein [Oscillospiraceae bacterium]
MALRINSNARKAAAWGVFSALALALSWAESTLAPLLHLPFGVKPGFSNIAVMLAAGTLGLPAGLAVSAAKALFAGVTRGPTALLLSGAGGVLSALVTGGLLRPSKKSRRICAACRVTETGVGILGGVTHNLAQLGLAALLTGTPGILWTAPALLICGGLAGAATGTLVKLLRRGRWLGQTK